MLTEHDIYMYFLCNGSDYTPIQQATALLLPKE